MAVDTPSKRASALGFGRPFRVALPPPDGTIGQADRQSLCGLYGGILSALPSNPIGAVDLTYEIEMNLDQDFTVHFGLDQDLTIGFGLDQEFSPNLDG